MMRGIDAHVLPRLFKHEISSVAIDAYLTTRRLSSALRLIRLGQTESNGQL